MSRDDVYVVLKSEPLSQRETEVTAVLVPRESAKDTDFAWRRLQNNGRSVRLGFVSRERYAHGAIIELEVAKQIRCAPNRTEFYSICSIDSRSDSTETYNFHGIGTGGKRADAIRRYNDPADGSFRAQRGTFSLNQIVDQEALLKAKHQPIQTVQTTVGNMLRRPTLARSHLY